MEVRQVLKRLSNVQKSRDGWTARCPAHDDSDPSLSVAEGRDGRVLLYCHAGCNFEEIRSALGLDSADLSSPSDSGPGYTLIDYADEKGLPAAELRQWGVKTRERRDKPPVVAIPYHDQDGEIDGVKIRNGEKFWWPEHSQLPYGLNHLADSSEDRPVLLVEGESDCHAAWLEDVLAVGVPGANGWRSEWTDYFEGREVFVWQEPDEAGEEFVESVTADLPEAKVIEAPEDAKDPAELHQRVSDDFRERLGGLMENAERVEVRTASPQQGPMEDQDKSQTDRLLALTADIDLFSDERDEPYARIEQGGHHELWQIDGERLRSWLAHRFYEREGKAPSASVLADAIEVLRGKALFQGENRKLANRFTWHDDQLWYDLADDQWRAIRVSSEGWQVVADPPALFRRYAHQSGQVTPVPTDATALPDLLRRYTNISEEADDQEGNDEALLAVWLVTALLANVPRPILILYGPQGSAKTFLAKLLRRLIDPSETPMPRFPNNDAEMAQTLDHHAAPFFDNVSKLSRRQSDTLCRAVTGDGFTKRKLYTNNEDVLYSFKRVPLLNGINIPAQQPDLLDRSLLMRLNRIREENRREEEELWDEFEKDRPQILGAMFSALSDAIALRSSVELGTLPRMADWTRWGYAVAEALGLGGEPFLEAYSTNQQAQNQEALGAHPLGAAVTALMEDREEWSGTPSDTLQELEEVAHEESIDTSAKLWPGAANWLRRRLNEVEPNLREAGIKISGNRGDSRSIRFETVETEASDGADGAVGADGNPERSDSSDDGRADTIDEEDGTGGDAVRMPSGSEAQGQLGADTTDGNDGISSGSGSGPMGRKSASPSPSPLDDTRGQADSDSEDLVVEEDEDFDPSTVVDPAEAADEAREEVRV